MKTPFTFFKYHRLCILFLIPLFLVELAAFSQKKMNVLFIVADDLRPALGCYGDTYAQTPNIDRLAARGTTFTSAYCQQAVCAPSRASFMTGKTPDHTKVWNLETHFRTALPNVVTLPQHFKNNGYQTRQIGKIYHDPITAQDPPSWSLPEKFAVTTNVGKYVLDSNLRRAPKATSMERADVPDSSYIDGMVADAAIQALQQHSNNPFFLAVGFRRPHLPFSVPENYWQKSQKIKFPLPKDTARTPGIPEFSWHHSVELRGYTDIPDAGAIDEKLAGELIRAYYTSVNFIDEQVGKLLHTLEQTGLSQNTIVVLLSDHGFHLGEHGLWGKTTNSRIDTRVPLIIAHPQQPKTNQVNNTVVQLLDLYATLSELCGLPKPETDGNTFAKILQGKAHKETRFAYSQFPDRMKFTNRPNIMGYRIHSANFGYTEWIETQTGKVIDKELYDYTIDPQENKNLANDNKYKQQMSVLSAHLKAYRQQ